MLGTSRVGSRDEVEIAKQRTTNAGCFLTFHFCFRNSFGTQEKADHPLELREGILLLLSSLPRPSVQSFSISSLLALYVCPCCPSRQLIRLIGYGAHV